MLVFPSPATPADERKFEYVSRQSFIKAVWHRNRRWSNMSRQCDGQRPVCTNCLGATSQCTYRDESDLSHESRKDVVDVVRMLNSMPATEAIRTLRVLGTETNAPVILSTLRDVARTPHRPSADSSAAATSSDAPEALEFEIQNPTAYPVLPGEDPMELDEALCPCQSASSSQDWASCW